VVTGQVRVRFVRLLNPKSLKAIDPCAVEGVKIMSIYLGCGYGLIGSSYTFHSH